MGMSRVGGEGGGENLPTLQRGGGAVDRPLPFLPKPMLDTYTYTGP